MGDRKHVTGSLREILENQYLTDTSPEIDKLHIELIRRMPTWKRLYLAVQMILTVRPLNLSRLRWRYPQAIKAELNRHLANLWLGSERTERVYVPLKTGEQ